MSQKCEQFSHEILLGIFLGSLVLNGVLTRKSEKPKNDKQEIKDHRCELAAQIQGSDIPIESKADKVIASGQCDGVFEGNSIVEWVKRTRLKACIASSKCRKNGRLKSQLLELSSPLLHKL